MSEDLEAMVSGVCYDNVLMDGANTQTLRTVQTPSG